ncbi:MAG: PspC domain-containing protein [Firmicutes bacterium]|nr:PspC domain-containing protein [Bacillota bacterium]
MEPKRLYRSRSQVMLAGVCAGIAEYFQLDPTLVRLGWVILSIFSAGFLGILAYIICAIIIPQEP